MKVNELRVGNYTDKGMVKSFYEHGIHVGMGKCYGFCDLKPIPLTEEILLKCGFKRVPKNLYVDNLKDLRTAVTYLKGSIIWNESTRIVWVGNIALDNIKYLHELQNLYYAVENKELEIKL